MDEQTTHSNINDNSYTNRELYLLTKANNDTNLLQHQSLIDSQLAFHKANRETLDIITNKIDEVIKAQKYTNGNVMDLLLWRATTTGKMFVFPIVIGAVIAGVVSFFFNNINLK